VIVKLARAWVSGYGEGETFGVFAGLHERETASLVIKASFDYFSKEVANAGKVRDRKN
jgi:hypothetical protein